MLSHTYFSSTFWMSVLAKSWSFFHSIWAFPLYFSPRLSLWKSTTVSVFHTSVSPSTFSEVITKSHQLLPRAGLHHGEPDTALPTQSKEQPRLYWAGFRLFDITESPDMVSHAFVMRKYSTIFSLIPGWLKQLCDGLCVLIFGEIWTMVLPHGRGVLTYQNLQLLFKWDISSGDYSFLHFILTHQTKGWQHSLFI